MRPSNKSRNRNKNNNNRRGSPGNNINRVFESAGPEGRVRGTPQQIIDKYLSLTYDAQLSGDRVSAENYQQHAEHYSRLLLEAQKELAEKQAEQQANNNQNVTHKNEEDQVIVRNQVSSDQSGDTALVSENTVLEFDKTIDKKTIKPKSLNNDSKQTKAKSSRRVAKKDPLEKAEVIKVSGVE
jgi:hypothetical protein